jgi:hypothetical protein
MNLPAQKQDTTVATIQQQSPDTLLTLIERLAKDQTVDLDRVERLIALRARMMYATALSEMQVELPEIKKKGSITIPGVNKAGEANKPIHYALWEDINEGIKPILAKHNFAISFRTGQAPDGKLTVTGILSHAGGHQEETTMVLPYDSTGSKNTVQSIGSSTSYGKRYTAAALLNLTARGEDDDGAAGGGTVDPPITPEQVAEVRKLLKDTGADEAKFLKFGKIEKLEDILSSKFDAALATIRGRAKAAARKTASANDQGS